MLWLYILLGVAAFIIIAEIGIAVYFFNYAVTRKPYDPYKKAEKYPEEIRPRKQTVPDELAKILWERFEREHGK